MSERTDGVIEARPYHRNYYRDVRGPKTAALKAVAAAACEICGYGWAAMYGGYKAAIFVCYRCCAKLIEWDHERERTLCQVCHAQPAISLHESTQLRCCFACKCSLPEVDADPWDTDKSWVTSFLMWIISMRARLRTPLSAVQRLRSRPSGWI